MTRIVSGAVSLTVLFNMLKVVSGRVALGLVLVGIESPAHVVTVSINIRGLIGAVCLMRTRGE